MTKVMMTFHLTVLHFLPLNSTPPNSVIRTPYSVLRNLLSVLCTPYPLAIPLSAFRLSLPRPHLLLPQVCRRLRPAEIPIRGCGSTPFPFQPVGQAFFQE
jgi:hypothetical protein